MFILISTVRKPIFHPNFKCFRNSTLKKKKAEHSRSRVRKRKLWKMFLRENEKKEICYVCNDRVARYRVPPFQLYSHSRRNRNVNLYKKTRLFTKNIRQLRAKVFTYPISMVPSCSTFPSMDQNNEQILKTINSFVPDGASASF